MSSGWLRKAAQQVESSADAARAMEKAKLEAVGVLNSRKQQIPREAGGLQAMLTRYLNGTIGQYEKTKDVKAERSDMLRRMEFVVNKVLGAASRMKQRARSRSRPSWQILSTEVSKFASIADNYLCAARTRALVARHT